MNCNYIGMRIGGNSVAVRVLLCAALLAVPCVAPLSLPVGMSVAAAAKKDVGTELNDLERDLYGVPQKGSVMERINEIEDDLTGQHYSGGLAMRLNFLKKLVYDSAEQPSLLAQMNAIEWSVSKEVSNKPLTERLDAAELSLSGTVSDGTLRERIAALSSLAFGSVTIPMEEVDVPKNTLVKIALTKEINVKNIVVGDIVPYKVTEDVTVGDVLVFAAGSEGLGTVKKVKQAKNFGRNAELEIELDKTKSVDGKFVKTFVGDEAKAEMKHLAYAAGASLAGILVFGPVGVVTGAFVHGKNIDLPAGSAATVQTYAPTKIWGVNVKFTPTVGNDNADNDAETDDNAVSVGELY